jgi:serine acetyltransferase
VHIAPGATLCGAICVGEGTLIGAGAVVIQGIEIGRQSLVASGAVVIHNVADNTRVAGVPARILTKKGPEKQ